MKEIFQRYFIRLAFDGTDFHGWQRQKNGVSVQQRLEETMSLLLKQKIGLTGAGRTDTGVHASEFYAHFDYQGIWNFENKNRLIYNLNSILGKNIAIDNIFPVQPDAHARFSALSRTYRYFIQRKKNPFRVNYSHFIYGDIDVGMMNKGASYLLDIKDFTSFSKVDTDTMTNFCDLHECLWDESNDELVLTIKANRFLRNMVRAVTGTLLDLGRHRITFDEFVEITKGKDRNLAGESVPAKGLFLTRIIYPENINVP